MSYRDDIERQKRALAEDYPNVGSGRALGEAKTYAMGNKPGPGLETTTMQPNLPAASSGGNATSGRTPVPPEAKNPQGDAGISPPAANIDLVQDRGTPMEFTEQQMQRMGSQAVIEEVTAPAVESASITTGRFAEDPERAKREGMRATKALGLDDDKALTAARKDMTSMFGNIIKGEVKDGIISKAEGKERKELFTNMFGGMTKQEFGLFLFDWGSRMMAYSNEAPGVAMGMASQGALQGLQGRRKEAAALEVEAGERTRKAGLEERRVGALEKNAESSRITADASAKRADAVGGGYRGEKAWLLDLGRKMGKTDDEVWEMFNKVKAPAVRRQELMDFILKTGADAGFTDVDPILGKKYKDFDQNDYSRWVQIMMSQEEAMSALEKYGASEE